MKKLSLSDLQAFVKHDLWPAKHHLIWHDWCRVRMGIEHNMPDFDVCVKGYRASMFYGFCALLVAAIGIVTAYMKHFSVNLWTPLLILFAGGFVYGITIPQWRMLRDFMRSCDEVCELLSISFLDLTRLTRSEVIGRGREILIQIAVTIERAEEANPQESLRDAFKKPFNLLKSFGYVEDSWKPYFDEARRRRMAEKRIEAEVMSQ